MFDGPVQGAEECATLLHHAVEVRLVEEVTLGITEVLGTKPIQRSQQGRGGSSQSELLATGRPPSLLAPGGSSPAEVHFPGL